MWVLLPVKRLEHSKLRLAGILTQEQRRQLSYCMLDDILNTLNKTMEVTGVTVISCDEAVISLAEERGAQVLNTRVDQGYAVDVLKGVNTINDKTVDKVLIIPADVPELEHTDVTHLDQVHEGGVTLCPAENDGGTNGMVFTPPLAIGLMYGENSFDEFRKEANKRAVSVNIARPAGLVRDIDRPDDLLALQGRPDGNRTWRYVKSLNYRG